jgi:hypothetical protein
MQITAYAIADVKPPEPRHERGYFAQTLHVDILKKQVCTRALDPASGLAWPACAT